MKLDDALTFYKKFLLKVTKNKNEKTRKSNLFKST